MIYFINKIATYIPEPNRYMLNIVMGVSYESFFDLQLSHFFRFSIVFFILIIHILMK